MGKTERASSQGIWRVPSEFFVGPDRLSVVSIVFTSASIHSGDPEIARPRLSGHRDTAMRLRLPPRDVLLHRVQVARDRQTPAPVSTGRSQTLPLRTPQSWLPAPWPARALA